MAIAAIEHVPMEVGTKSLYGRWLGTYGIVVMDTCGAGACNGDNQKWEMSAPAGQPANFKAAALEQGAAAAGRRVILKCR